MSSFSDKEQQNSLIEDKYDSKTSYAHPNEPNAQEGQSLTCETSQTFPNETKDNLHDRTSLEEMHEEISEELSKAKSKRCSKLCNVFHSIIPIFAIIFAHTSYGLQPVFSKYFINKAKLSPLSLVCVGYFIAFVIYLPRAIYVAIRAIVKRQNVLKTFVIPLFKNWKLYAFIVSAVMLNVGIVISTKYTLAAYTQLILLFTPFLVSFTSRFVFKERISIATWISMCFTILGGVLLVLSGTSDSDQFHWLIDFSNLSLTWNDAIGMVISLLSACFLCMYMVLIRYCQSEKMNPRLNSEFLYFIQIFTCSFFPLPISFTLKENWSQFIHLDTVNWVLLFTNAIVVFVLGNLFQMYGIYVLGAPAAASILALRLVAALVFSYILLNEILNNFWQIVGTVIVIVSVSSYMIYNYIQSRRKSVKKKKENESKKLSELNDGEVELQEVDN